MGRAVFALIVLAQVTQKRVPAQLHQVMLRCVHEVAGAAATRRAPDRVRFPCKVRFIESVVGSDALEVGGEFGGVCKVVCVDDAVRMGQELSDVRGAQIYLTSKHVTSVDSFRSRRRQRVVP